MQNQFNHKQKNTPNILIVEDDPVCAFLAESILKKYYTTTTVSNGHDALIAIEKERYDIILMDINLNDDSMDGLKTMRMIRYHRRHKHIKILAVTMSYNAKEWFISLGFDEHHIKPIMERSIVERITKLLENTTLAV